MSLAFPCVFPFPISLCWVLIRGIPYGLYRGLGETERGRSGLFLDAGVSVAVVTFGEEKLPVDSVSPIACPSTERDILFFLARRSKRSSCAALFRRYKWQRNSQLAQHFTAHVAISSTVFYQLVQALA